MDLDGVNDVIEPTIGGDTGNINTVTFGVWLKPRTQDDFDGIFMTRATNTKGLMIGSAAGNQLTCMWEGTRFDMATGMKLILNSWNFVVFTKDADTTKGYLYSSTGTSTYSDSVSNFPNGVTGLWHIGQDGPDQGPRFIDGPMANVRFWDRTLSADEVQEAFMCADSPANGLRGQWMLWDTGNAYDLSGNGNHGVPEIPPIAVSQDGPPMNFCNGGAM